MSNYRANFNDVVIRGDSIRSVKLKITSLGRADLGEHETEESQNKSTIQSLFG